VSLGATFEILGPDGPRHLTAAELFVLPSQNPTRENTLGATDLLTGVRIPTPAVHTVSTYLKITDRAAWTHAEVSVAVVLQVEGPHIQTASVVLGGVAPIPWRLPEVEQWLRGQDLSAPVAGQAGALAMAHAQPLAKNGHKVPMTNAAVERALLRLVR
jgi:xanthine dehydrogenase YagS FAD-binding subunit